MNRKIIQYSSIVASLAFVAVFLGAALLNTPESEAAGISDFKAGNIIDDEVFYNKDSMAVAEIQALLNRFAPSCDTWGTGAIGSGRYVNGKAVPANTTRAKYAEMMRKAGNSLYHEPPYICVNNYYENPTTHRNSFDTKGKVEDGMISAAQIIYNAAQEYGINPQVLLVLLKKESYLFGDNWPTRNEYDTVMGYACPDNAKCNEKYFGFYNQVSMAAWQFNYYKEHIYDYNFRPFANNQIYYSPTTSCGKKTVYIENIATASLYIYTPYTPNDAALKTYPGTATCGSYGNRNFYMYFVEWFGTTRAPKKTEQQQTQQQTQQQQQTTEQPAKQEPTKAETSAQTTQPAQQQQQTQQQTQTQQQQTAPQTTEQPKADPYAAIKTKIAARYKELGGEKVFGKATRELGYTQSTDIYWQFYENGAIIGNDKYGYYESRGKIRTVWKNSGSETGTLGYPTSDIKTNKKTGIYWQNYTNGVIVGNDKYGYYESRGKIRAVWQSFGFESGKLGFPTSNIQTNKKTGIYWQNYTGGVIVGNDKYGYYESRGKIRAVWQKFRYESGALGFPTSNIKYNKKTGIYWQNYTGGVIVGNDKYGYYESRGKLRSYWQRTGFESGWMGWPKSNIITSGKTIYQHYTRGTLYYNTSTGRYTWR